jgi:hypothetical protein
MENHIHRHAQVGTWVLINARWYQAAVAADANVDIGNKLADMLRSGRSVVSASQPLINNPDLGDKGLTGEKLVHDAAAIYADRVGAPLLTDDLSERDRRLLDAQMRTMQRIVDEH